MALLGSLGMLRWLLLLCLGLTGNRLYHRFDPTTLEVLFWDVGQGDASLIRFPGGKTLLIDAGEHAGRLVPELARLGVLSLDAAILSHPDRDHGEGFTQVWRDIPTLEFWVNGRESLSPAKPLLRRLLRTAAGTEVSVRFVNREETIEMDGVEVRRIPLGDAAESSNDRTLAVWLGWKGCRFAFTGDMEAKGEREFFSKVPKGLTVLKVAHHGSFTSSWEKALARARPTWAVLSSGAGNSYGHPHPRVTERLRNLDVNALRTDFHGYVKFVVSEEEVECWSSAGPCGRQRCSKELIERR